MEQEEKRIIEEKIVKNKQLFEKYLESAVNKGVTLTQTKKLLIDNGWPKDFVTEYCDNYFKANKERINSLRKEVKVGLEESTVEVELEKINKKLGMLK